MMENLEKTSGYLKGLMECIDLPDDPALKKLLPAMVDAIINICDHTTAQKELLEELNDYVESIDDDLSMLESDNEGMPFDDDDDDDSDFYDFDDDDDDDEDDDEDEDYENDNIKAIEDHLHVLGRHDDDDDDDEADYDVDDELLSGAICPQCKRMFYIVYDDSSTAKYKCPYCENIGTVTRISLDDIPVASPIIEK